MNSYSTSEAQVADSVDFNAVYVDGEWRPSRGTQVLPVISPYTEERLTTVRAASADDVDDAARAAWSSLQSGVWSRRSLDERCEVVERIKRGLAARRDELVDRSVATLGHPITRARQVSNVDVLIEQAMHSVRAVQFEYRRSNQWGDALIRRQPVGVVAGICPWNAPTRTEVQKTVPALLSGCSVVLKSDPQTPYAARILTEVAAEAGLPPGVLNVVFGGPSTGEALVRHPLVRLVSFTGSSATGSAIGAICGASFKRMVLELGGKSALIILDDADIDAAMTAAAAGNFGNAGQACIGLTRVLAPRRLYGEIVQRLSDRARSFVLGDPRQATTTMGPVVSARQRDRVLGLIEEARADGASIVTGGKRPKDQPRGWFVEPTVIADADPSSTIAQEEIFGPVATVIPYDDEDQAIAVANHSKYGLHGAVFSKDPDHALRIALRIDSGSMGINCFGLTGTAPFGGVKASGIGREYGPEGFDTFLEYTSYSLDLSGGGPPGASANGGVKSA